MPNKRYQSFFRTPSPQAKIPGSAHVTTIKPTVLDADAHLCLLASEEEKVNLGFCEQFHIAIAMSESGEFSCKPMKGRQLMGGFQSGGGGGDRESGPPEKSPKNGFLSILVRFPLKSQSYQVSIPLGYQSAKRHLNGVSLAGQ